MPLEVISIYCFDFWGIFGGKITKMENGNFWAFSGSYAAA